ncbi:MAG: helix-turn-helix transcriptional regulator [Burkholderiales bacterium]
MAAANQQHFPQTGFVRLPQVLSVIPVGRSTWWEGVRSGRYPQPVRTLGRRITCWRVEDIRALIQKAAA